MQLDSVVDVRKKLKCDFSTFIGNKELNLFTYFSGFVTELSNSSRENNDEYVVEAFVKVGQLDELKVIQIEKNIQVINMLLDESSSSSVEVNACLAIEGRDNSNICGYLLYAEDIDAKTGSIFRNSFGNIFPIKFHNFVEFYKLDNIKIRINKNNIFFSSSEVDVLIKEIKRNRLIQLKSERIANCEKMNQPKNRQKNIGIEYAIKLWDEDQGLSKNQVSQLVHDYIESLEYKKITKPKNIATTWLTVTNIPNMPDHASCLGAKKSK